MKMSRKDELINKSNGKPVKVQIINKNNNGYEP